MTVDYIVDKTFELIMEKGIDFFKQYKQQSNNMDILYNVTKRFANSDYFKCEYGGIIYIDEKEILMQIDPEKISPILKPEEIVQNIRDVFSHIFIGDENVIEQITKILVLEYLSKRELTLKLLDLAILEKNNTETILNNIEEAKYTINRINEFNEEKQYRKERVIKIGLGRKMDSFISQSVGLYLQWINKGNVTHVGNEIPITIQYFGQIEEMLKEGFPKVDENFYKMSVRVTQTNGVPFVIRDVSSIDFVIYMHTQLETKADDLLKLSNFLPDEFLFIMLELLDFFSRNPMYDPASRGFSEIFINGRPAAGTKKRDMIVSELEQLGKIISKFRPLYNLWLE